MESKEKKLFENWDVRNQGLNAKKQEHTMLQQRKGGGHDETGVCMKVTMKSRDNRKDMEDTKQLMSQKILFKKHSG